MIPISPWRGFTRYLRNALNLAEGWQFAEPFFPSFSVDGMHWAGELGIAEITATVTAGADTSTINLVVPANEAWLVLVASAQISQVASGQATPGQIRLDVNMDGNPMVLTEAVTGSTRCGVQSVWTPPYPILMHAGDSFSARIFNAHIADLVAAVRVMRRRLPSASTP